MEFHKAFVRCLPPKVVPRSNFLERLANFSDFDEDDPDVDYSQEFCIPEDYLHAYETGGLPAVDYVNIGFGFHFAVVH